MVEKTVQNYIDKAVWEINENANLDYSFSSVFFRLAGDAISDYVLKRIYPKKIARAHIDGDFHLHNLYMGIVGYCAGWSIRDILSEGFNGVPGKIESSPPKHFSTALLQLSNFVGTLQNEWAGAQAFNSLDTLLAPFVRKDKLDYKQVKQHMQQFIYNLNISSRWGGQTPFTNITFDITVPEDLKDEYVIMDGKMQDQTYSGYEEEMDMINKAFMEAMLEGICIKEYSHSLYLHTA
jgi:ribonucleoside-triphosphate reductase